MDKIFFDFNNWTDGHPEDEIHSSAVEFPIFQSKRGNVSFDAAKGAGIVDLSERRFQLSDRPRTKLPLAPLTPYASDR